MSIWPATRSCAAGAVPRYGTSWKRVPVRFCSSTAAMCDGLPTPAVPSDALSGLALSQAIRPLRSLTGRSFLTAISHGVAEINATGAKSAITS